MAAALRAVVDSNAVDQLADSLEVVAEAVDHGRVELLWTHITVDELSAIPDVERRARLLCTAALLCRFVLTGVTVLDYSRLGLSRLGDETEAFEAFRLGNLKHTADAIITSTAQFEQCGVLSEDRGLRNRATARGVATYTLTDLLRFIAESADKPSPDSLDDA